MSVKTQSLNSILDQLNEQQRAAATHGQGPLLIVAGAGTGKTTTLAHRVACRIAAGISPSRILLVTFTRRAAAEMLRRVDGILRRIDRDGSSRSKPASRHIQGGTFHSAANRLLSRHARHLGLSTEFTVLDRSDSEDLMNVIRSDLNLPDAATRFPLKGTCSDIYSRCVNTQKRIEHVLETAFPWCIEHREGLSRLFKAYVSRKEAQSVFDYDDLLLFWKALMDHDRGGEEVRGKFDCVLVDEYQDTNVLQASILKALCPDGQGLTVVGDDAQSIYSFRAATVRNILDFPTEFPGTEVVTLEQNYRSTQPILDVTNRVIAEAGERHRKELVAVRTGDERPVLVTCADEDYQTEYVVDAILDRREEGVELSDQAVLFRASHHSLALEVELGHRNIPFHKYGGLKFIETAHIKDLLAFLRLGENPFDVVAGMRVLTLLSGIGRKRAAQLMAMVADAGGHLDVWETWSPPAASAGIWPDFTALIRRLKRRSGESGRVAADIHLIRDFYGPLLEQKYDNSQARLRDLEQLEHVSSRYPDRQTFLTDMALDPPSSTQDLADDPHLDEDYLCLSTIHSAKGLEWDSVYILHASDGNIPSDMATKSPEEVEEERRLLYVAMTRARNRLQVLRPLRYYFHNRRRSDAHSYAELTRFLPAHIQELFERRVATFDDTEACEPLSSADVRRQLENLWGSE